MIGVDNFSKKGLPMPPGLPAPLRAFLSTQGQSESIATYAKLSSFSGSPAELPNVSPVPVPSARLSVSKAFDSIQEDVDVASKYDHSAPSTTTGESDEVSHGVLDLAAASKKLMGTQNAALEVSCLAICFRFFFTYFFKY